MLRQIHIFYEKKHIFTMNYAFALGNEDLKKVTEVIQAYLDMPIPGKILHRPVANYQIFHGGVGSSYFLFIADLVDSLNYINNILKKTMNKFKELFPNPENFKESSEVKTEFLNFLKNIQHELHSKIAIVGPNNSGKSTLYNMIKSGQERTIMNFARSSFFLIDDLSFDIWDFQLKDNFSLLWNKLFSGSDLIILLFDCSNYKPNVINHFLTLQKTESKFSRLLIVANKRDLVRDEEIEKIKKNLNISNLKELSLINSDAGANINFFIRETLNLKKVLPQNFEELLKIAENLASQGNSVTALIKYKELLNTCNKYQDYSHIKDIKKKIEEIQLKLEKDKIIRNKIYAKKELEVPAWIKSSKKIEVKALPTRESQIPSRPLRIPPKPLEKSVKPQKLVLTPRDIKISLNRLEKPKKKVIRPLPTTEDLKEFSDFVNAIQILIEQKGTSLSQNLCREYIKEIQKSLAGPITLDDLKFAAESFIKFENQNNLI
ncbi:MAG: ADP-ribosylation factor-like protein [Promethearchaeota archaeon]